MIYVLVLLLLLTEKTTRHTRIIEHQSTVHRLDDKFAVCSHLNSANHCPSKLYFLGCEKAAPAVTGWWPTIKVLKRERRGEDVWEFEYKMEVYDVCRIQSGLCAQIRQFIFIACHILQIATFQELFKERWLSGYLFTVTQRWLML